MKRRFESIKFDFDAIIKKKSGEILNNKTFLPTCFETQT